MGQVYNSIIGGLNSSMRTFYLQIYSFLNRFDIKGLWNYKPLIEEHKSLEGELGRLRNRYSGDIQQITEEIERGYSENLRKAISEERERILKEREERVKGLESKLAEIQRRFDATKTNYAHLQRVHLENRGRVVELEEQVIAYQSHLKELEGLTKEQTNYMQMYAAAVEQMEALNQQLAEQDGITLDLRNELQTQRKRLSELGRTCQSQSSSLKAEIDKNARLGQQIAEYQSLRDYKGLYEKALREIEDLKQVLSRRNEQISRLTNELRAAQNRVAEPESSHEEDTPTLAQMIDE